MLYPIRTNSLAQTEILTSIAYNMTETDLYFVWFHAHISRMLPKNTRILKSPLWSIRKRLTQFAWQPFLIYWLWNQYWFYTQGRSNPTRISNGSPTASKIDQNPTDYTTIQAIRALPSTLMPLASNGTCSSIDHLSTITIK